MRDRLEMLLILFVPALKLVGVINWPWWLVLAPFWVPLWLVLSFLVLVGKK